MRIRTHTNPFSCTQQFKKLEPKKVFPSFQGKLDFEIGFGQSSFIKDYATHNQDRLVVGIEVRKKAADIMAEKIKQENINNVHIVHGNGTICLQDMFTDRSLDNIFIFHPDPWMKKRHYKRRLINNKFLEIAQKKLKLGGKIHVSTDVESLWEQIISEFSRSTNFVQQKHDTFWKTYYSTRWDDIVQEKNRKTFYSTFYLTKTP